MPLPVYKDLAALEGRPVMLRADDQQRAGTLASVTALTRHPGHARQPFSMVILSEDQNALPQQIFEVEIEGRAPLSVFLVPIGPRDGRMAYEAVFS